MESREISATIRELSEERKQTLREEIQERAAFNRLLGKPVRQAMLQYTLDLLEGNTPMPMRHRNPAHRNGKVVIINAGKVNSQ